MIAITIQNPWAFVIAETAALAALGVEPKVENRGRPVAARHVGQPIAIHAGLGWSKEGERDGRVRQAWKTFAEGIGCCRKTPDPRLAAIGDLRSGCPGHGALSRNKVGMWMEAGAVVAMAILADCHEATGPCVSRRCGPWGDLYYGDKPAYHIVFADVRRLREPVPAKGRLSVPWTLPEDVAAQVQAQLDRQVAA